MQIKVLKRSKKAEAAQKQLRQQMRRKMDPKLQQVPKAEDKPANHKVTQVEEFAKLVQKWEDLKVRFEVAERNNESLRAHVQDLLTVVLKLNTSVMVWKCATGFFAIALIAVVFASLFVY